ncbi:MAG TPA: hypothetical protein DIW81_05605 [Planctomycetaceae bacterium]|nr:hypothetical protein [Planctomycetaceae bacterium]|tara:strand:- start:647 stop:874 length:228 start_codon:yes stop_codon:yes gene_type:complete
MLRDARAKENVQSAFWKKPETSMMARFGLAIDIPTKFGSTLINPIGKAFKVFQDGDGDLLKFLLSGTMNILSRNK